MKKRLLLPPLIRRSPSGLAYLFYWAPFIAVYQLLNRWPLFEPRQLPLTWLDRVIPFEPALLPVYVAYIPLYWWTVARSENDREANRILYASYFQLLLCAPFFLFLPVRMPRELFYHGQVFNCADAFWNWFDAPNNCFPSLHVSNALLLAHFNWSRAWRVPFVAASAAVVLSTVLVKQHYVVDVLAGIGVYLVTRQLLARMEIATADDPGIRGPGDELDS